MNLTPATRPRATRDDIVEIATRNGIAPENGDALFVVGIRGYYRDTMGAVGANDRRIYDDAIFVVTPNGFAAFNGNVDPNGVRKGHGFADATKGMANLKPGLYRSHQLGLHKKQYLALVQTGGKVTVIRDGNPPYADSGFHGINIHRGGVTSTSSIGCQTIPPAQWPEFIGMVSGAAKALSGANWRTRVIPYLLVEGPIR